MNVKYILIMAALPLLASCSALQGNRKTAGTVTGDMAQKRPGVTTTQTPQAGAPADTDAKPDASSKQAASARNLAGEWLMVKVGGNAVDRDEDMPYLIFEEKTGKFYGSNGCNVLNGSYTLSADDVFTFSNVATTMRYCPDVDFQHEISVVLADGASTKARFRELGNESYIDMLSQSGKVLIELRRANIDFLNGQWEVTSINGADVLPDVVPDIFFDIAERKVHGNTGCNYFNGEIYLDHRVANAIDLSRMALTRMACPYSQQETALMVALEKTTTALSGGKDRAMLLDAEGHEMVALRRVTPDK